MDDAFAPAPHQIDAFRRAVDLVGGQESFAELVGMTQPTVSRRLRAQMPLWAEMVLKVEAATGISRHELRPDIYPIEPPAAVEADPASRAEPVPDSDLRSSSGTGDPLGMVA